MIIKDKIRYKIFEIKDNKLLKVNKWNKLSKKIK
jgi:hypothetical protein